MLIANRGEIALRVIRSCKELGLKTVAVHSTADHDSLHRFFSDEDVCIGDAPAKDSYLYIPRIIAAAEITGADAIHPGYGLLSENHHFAEACEENNINFIGPTKEIIKTMGDKATSRRTMKEAGIPIIEGSELLNDIDEALDFAKKITYPIILKATSGGGGKGMRICQNSKELKQSFELARVEAEVNFGNPEIYMEKFIEKPHHIEVQILGDKHGNVVHLGERDCSVQRRHQKLVEECPSSYVKEETKQKMFEVAIKAAKSINYIGAGTIEFLVDAKQNFYFMEMNTRIQVEHTISEVYTSIDIVKEQVRVADGKKLQFKQEDVNFYGHAIECRINADDPYHDFRPSAGKIIRYHVPQGLGVRVDSHIYEGYEIPPNYDSMIGKLICWGRNREEAISRLKRCLKEYVIDGINTSIPFHLELLKNKEFLSGNYDTSLIERIKMKEKK